MLSPFRCLALSAAAFVTLAGTVRPALAADAYDANKGWTYIGGAAYGFKGDSKRDADHGWGSRAFIGARMPGGFRFEASAYGQQGKRDSDNGKDPTLGAGLDMLIPLTSGGASPFFLIGGGYAKEEVLGRKDGSGYVNVGVGGLLPITDFINMRIETRYVEMFNDFADTRGDGPLYDLQLGLGFQAELGRPAPRRIIDRDGDGVPD